MRSCHQVRTGHGTSTVHSHSAVGVEGGYRSQPGRGTEHAPARVLRAASAAWPHSAHQPREAGPGMLPSCHRQGTRQMDREREGGRKGKGEREIAQSRGLVVPMSHTHRTALPEHHGHMPAWLPPQGLLPDPGQRCTPEPTQKKDSKACGSNHGGGCRWARRRGHPGGRRNRTDGHPHDLTPQLFQSSDHVEWQHGQQEAGASTEEEEAPATKAE